MGEQIASLLPETAVDRKPECCILYILSCMTQLCHLMPGLTTHNAKVACASLCVLQVV